MARREIAKSYLALLEIGDIERVIALFSPNAIVHSPIYGIKNASLFYKELASDTQNSKLELKGIFEDPLLNQLAIYFNYQWTLTNGKVINFDVVDILDFDENDKIIELRIIYDTAISREAIESLKI